MKLSLGAFLMPKYNIIIGLTPEDLRKKQAVEMIYTAAFEFTSIIAFSYPPLSNAPASVGATSFIRRCNIWNTL